MTFARYSRSLWVEPPAKVARPAKVEQEQDVAVARSLLKPAKVEEASVRISHALAELSPAKSAGNLDFSRFSSFSQPRVECSELSDRPLLVRQWEAGVNALLAMSRPKAYPADCWSSLLDDADRFIKRWADQAARLGWQSWEVWGVHPYAPRYRFDVMGLVPMLHGQRITALTAEAAVVETSTSNLLRFYRRSSDSLSKNEHVLVWELT